MPELQEARSASLDMKTQDSTDSQQLQEDMKDGASGQMAEVISVHSSTEYRLYRRRFVGMVGLVVLNLIAAMAWPWFGPISNNMVDEFGITLDQVNWLGNVMAIMYLPVALLIPDIIRRYGIRRCCDIGAVAMLISAWIRYAATPRSLSPKGAYALLLVGQFFAAVAQPIYQVIGPKYSETWFDLQGRTTATMVLSISNPIGGALGQLISPIVGDTRQSILVLAIMATVASPFVFLVASAPPTPPTYSASKKSPGMLSLLRVVADRPQVEDPPMSLRERIDFIILFVVFGILSAATNIFGVLTGEILQPVGYSAATAGFMGAVLLLSGIVAAIVTAPLFDRVFTNHLAITTKIFVPVLGAFWLSLVWAVKPNFTAGLYTICALIGVLSVVMLPVSLELACEVTRNSDGSSALMWFSCNLWATIMILVEGALRASPTANPPQNMKRALIFNGVLVLGSSLGVFFIQGKQTRKSMDREKQQQRATTHPLEDQP